MSDEYPRITFSMKLGQDTMTVRAETADEVRATAQELVDTFKAMADVATAAKNAFGVTEASVQAETQVSTTQRKTYGKTVKPGAKPSGGKVCTHGNEWKDANGATTKAGQPYKYRFYNTCGNRECAPWGDQE